MSAQQCLRFVPSRVEGLPDVSEVAVFPERLELLSAGRWVTFFFADIAEWPHPVWFHRFLAKLGWRPRWLPVADRNWFHSPPNRFFAFFTTPKIVVYMPDDTGVEYSQTCFRRVQEVLWTGGLHIFDLG
jgi:hypothetical protein